MDEMREILERLGRMANDIQILGATTRNIEAEYRELIEKLKEMLGGDNLKEKLILKDKMIAEVYDKNGNLKQRVEGEDLVVNVGKAQVAGLINGVVTSAFKYIAIGTGTTSPSASDTGLGNEIKRKSATTSRVTTSVSNDTAQLEATFSSSDGLSDSSAVTESGVFDASSGGNMLCRQTFSVLNIDWDSGDTLKIIWQIQVQ